MLAMVQELRSLGNLLLKRKIVSSSLIRSYLEKGFLKEANKLLNRNWSIEGVVQKGRQIGKKIGFPTCNIDIGDYVLAKPGVYAVKVLRKNIYFSISSIKWDFSKFCIL